MAPRRAAGLLLLLVITSGRAGGELLETTTAEATDVADAAEDAATATATVTVTATATIPATATATATATIPAEATATATATATIPAEATATATLPADQATTTPGAPQLMWATMRCNVKILTSYMSWMADNTTQEYQQLASNVTQLMSAALETAFGDDFVEVLVREFTETREKVSATFYSTLRTQGILEGEANAALVDSTEEALSTVKDMDGIRLNELTISSDVQYVEAPPTTPAPTETTVSSTELTDTTARKKRSTTLTDTTVTSTVTASETSSVVTTAAATAAETRGATSTTAADTTGTAGQSTTPARNSTTVEEGATTEAGNTTTVVANTTTAAESTTAEANTTTAAPTTTTTEAPQPVSAKLNCHVKISNMQFQEWMKLSFTDAYMDLADRIKADVTPALENKFGDDFISVEVMSFTAGSVIAELDVTVRTNETNGDDVSVPLLTSETTAALQNVVESSDGLSTYDPTAVQVSDVIETIDPTTTPAPTEDPYKSNIIRFTMRAPNANWTDEMNDTDSAIFDEMDRDIDRGVKEMLSKKYPAGQWNVTAAMISMWNDTTETEEGIWINFVVSVEPQMRNTTEIVIALGKAYVYFNRLGNLQIDPGSVNAKDMTTYAPGLGVVIMDAEYLRELRKSRYNGSYVGDYTTQRPTLRPVIKRSKGYIMGIALPAFLGMLGGIGLLLICTTIAGAKKTDD